jgi:dTDP-glucose pyrophosphorylase
MNIVIPMVGLGKRFQDAGFMKQKPLIEVSGKKIVEHAIESFDIDANYIFIVRKSKDIEELKKTLLNLKPYCTIIETEELTDGSVSSILLAKDFINNDDELISTNCDQRTDWDSSLFLNFCRESGADGVVVTYPRNDIVVGQTSPYSFIKVDDSGNAIKLEEKNAISNHSLCGIHYWKKGRDFVVSAESMISHNDRVNNEFYVSKTYNYLINSNKKVKYFEISRGQFHSLGTPSDLEDYIKFLAES